MDQEVEALRIRIEGTRRGSDGRRIFTAPVKKDAVELARRWRAAGQRINVLADALGMHEKTLTAWLAGRKTKRKVRAVEIAGGMPNVGSNSADRLGTRLAIKAGGVCIEGLQLAEVIELVRALR